MRKIRFIIFALLLTISFSLLASPMDYGVVNEIEPSQNVIYFKLNSTGGYDGGADCLAGTPYRYFIAIDESSTNIKTHTLGSLYYPMILYSLQFSNVIKVQLDSSTVCPAQSDIYINYLTMAF